MNVPVENLYYLLVYAWDRLDAVDLVDVGSVAGQSADALLARMLLDGAGALLRRGLDRSYRERSEDRRMPRGKLDLSTTMKRNLLRRQRVACRFDEFTTDVLHNRLIKATLMRAARMSGLTGPMRGELREVARRMAGVTPVDMRPELFSRVRLHRNNRHYAFALHVCELLNRHLLPTQTAGEWRLRDFRGEDTEMGHLFERFVRNFAKRELPELKPWKQGFAWQAEPLRESELDLLPRHITDVPLRLGHDRVIVECKFVRQPLVTTRGGQQRLRSKHLNQLFTYLVNAPGDRPPRGVLLYASVGRALDLHYRLSGYELSVRTIDLAQPWAGIRRDLLQLLRGLFAGLEPAVVGVSSATAGS